MKTFLLCLLLAVPAALPAVPYLVKDLDTSPSMEPGQIAPADLGTGPGVSYFAAGDPAHGVELWRSDGTPGGTERLTDVCAGRCGAQPAVVAVQAGHVFFQANDSFSGDELWVSDGTPGSERRVRDLCPGPCSADPILAATLGNHPGDPLLFIASFPESPRFELWRTDGTREGTALVKVLCSGIDCTVEDLRSIGGKALLLVDGLDLWTTDGTADGTRPLLHFAYNPNLGFLPELIPDDGFAWMWGNEGLWRSDGTDAGTILLKGMDELTVRPDLTRSLDRHALWHGLLVGFVSSGEVVRSDGTPQGTFRIARFGSAPEAAAPLDSEVLFQISDVSNHLTLWSTRGTVETTGPKLVEEAAEAPSGLARLSGDRAVFLAQRNDPGQTFDQTQLWVTDGTAAGTRQISVSPSGVFSNGQVFVTGDGRAFVLRNVTGDDLWITDGTEAGTFSVRDFGDVPGSSGPLEQAALRGASGNRLVFSAATSDDRAPLFVSDGTTAGTGLLSAQADRAFSFFPFGGRLLFSASGPGGAPPLLWTTDGTPGGTAVLSRQTGFSNPALLGGQILFAGLSGLGTELWKTDGRPHSVQLVKDIDPFIVEIPDGSLRCFRESSSPVFAEVVGGHLLFAADDGRSGRELWASDGTTAGTAQVRDIRPGRSSDVPWWCGDPRGPYREDIGLSSNSQGFVLLGSVVLFTADDGLRGRELWVSNGTFRGTHRVVDLVPGPRGSAPHDLVRFGDRVYFLAPGTGAGGPGESLWKTDGTAQGTTRVLDLTLDGLPSWGRSLTVAAGRLFFSVYNETTGAELWASTGDAGGTSLLTDLRPGPGNSSPQLLTAEGRLLLFAADDGLTGLEPWRSDGTAAGTFRVGDIAPGRDASSPGPFTALSNLVMTGADDGVHGRELWAIPKTDVFLEP
jgi:ELWxxDGT repeat protein